ncbi:MAG: 6-pyruvoyltetrahydropterin/6-carboxytetrahydropterin synthase [Myxococcota bacterium]|jgi:6-pyruvoyltetrahydropterin/6-carboxytetrahydropterin synthase
MYRLGVREHVMIAHSFHGAIFGPAQRLHGATYIVDVEFARKVLDSDGLVVDIGIAGELAKEILAPMSFQNLDELPQFTGKNTTTEFLAHHLYTVLKERILAGALGESGRTLDELKVTLHESHVAWASFGGPIAA